MVSFDLSSYYLVFI